MDSFNLQYGILILLLSLLSLQFPAVEAQAPSPPDGYPYARFSPSMAIIIVVLIAALFFMGFFSVYIRHCSQGSTTGNTIRQTLSMRRRTAATRGLEASVLETFPTFTYAEVKDHKIGKGALECAVCLNEFEDEETLRLIPKCDHVFHPECIDAWLESHVTCPVCRANLVPDAAVAPPEVPVMTSENVEQTVSTSDPPRTDEVSIRVESDEEREREGGDGVPEGLNRSGSLNRTIRSWSIRRPFEKFRSHSTGHSLANHSLVLPGENLDRFTLRLPEGVRKEVITKGLLNRTGSCAGTVPRQGSTRRGTQISSGDGSARGGSRFYGRIDVPGRAVRSERWSFTNISRALSMKSPKVVNNGEGSSSSKMSKMAARMPSFKCLEPKSADEAGLVRSDSDRSPV